MSHETPETAPDAVRDAVPDTAEREALDHVWRALAEARPAPRIDPDARAAMRSAILSATVPIAGAGMAVVSAPALATVEGTSAGTGAGATTAPVIPLAPRRRAPWFALAAAAAVIVAVGLSARPGAWQSITVPLADRAQLTLPDGSTVELDAGTTVRYREGFRGWGWGDDARNRVVVLEGSAFFSVVSNAQPFEVHSYNATVRVLGTQFSVDARASEASGTIVAVAEGRVSVRGTGVREAGSPEGDEEKGEEGGEGVGEGGGNAEGEGALEGALELAPGERTVVAHGATSATAASSIPLNRVAPWRTGGLVVIDEPLRQFVRAVERKYGVRIALPADSAVSERQVTFYYPTAVPIERVLSDLATTQALRWSLQADGYVLE